MCCQWAVIYSYFLIRISHEVFKPPLEMNTNKQTNSCNVMQLVESPGGMRKQTSGSTFELLLKIKSSCLLCRQHPYANRLPNPDHTTWAHCVFSWELESGNQFLLSACLSSCSVSLKSQILTYTGKSSGLTEPTYVLWKTFWQTKNSAQVRRGIFSQLLLNTNTLELISSVLCF